MHVHMHTHVQVCVNMPTYVHTQMHTQVHMKFVHNAAIFDVPYQDGGADFRLRSIAVFAKVFAIFGPPPVDRRLCRSLVTAQFGQACCLVHRCTRWLVVAHSHLSRHMRC